jgi:hypothetical protein
MTQNRVAQVPSKAVPDQAWSGLEAEVLGLFVQISRIIGHPCKIYNVLAVGAPVIYIGPEPNHVTEILEGLLPPHTWVSVRHGAVEVLVGHIQRLRVEIAGKAGQPTAPAASAFSQAILLPQLVAVLDQPRTMRSIQ